MSPAAKTFTSGSTLPAADINNYLNPSTAEHIPAAMAAGMGISYAAPAASGGATTVTITFPPGRFTSPPSVSANSNNGRHIVAVQAVNTTSATVAVFNWTSVASVGVLNWIAVQM